MKRLVQLTMEINHPISLPGCTWMNIQIVESHEHHSFHEQCEQEFLCQLHSTCQECCMMRVNGYLKMVEKCWDLDWNGWEGMRMKYNWICDTVGLGNVRERKIEMKVKMRVKKKRRIVMMIGRTENRMKIVRKEKMMS